MPTRPVAGGTVPGAAVAGGFRPVAGEAGSGACCPGAIAGGGAGRTIVLSCSFSQLISCPFSRKSMKMMLFCSYP